MKPVTKRLRVRRAELGLTQRDLALKTRIPPGRYWEIENGYRTADADEQTRIARALKALASEVFDAPQSEGLGR